MHSYNLLELYFLDCLLLCWSTAAFSIWFPLLMSKSLGTGDGQEEPSPLWKAGWAPKFRSLMVCAFSLYKIYTEPVPARGFECVMMWAHTGTFHLAKYQNWWYLTDNIILRPLLLQHCEKLLWKLSHYYILCSLFVFSTWCKSAGEHAFGWLPPCLNQSLANLTYYWTHQANDSSHLWLYF